MVAIYTFPIMENMLLGVNQGMDRKMAKAQRVKNDYGVKTETLYITPDVAAEMLKNNPSNRPISSSAVKRYAREMRNEKWVFNGEPIIISDEGTLIDGQHRLNAIIDSGTTQMMVVITGIEKKAFTTIDIGKKRSGADALSTFDKEYAKNAGVIAAAINTIMEFKGGDTWTDQRSARGSHKDTIEFMTKNKGLMRSVDFVGSLNGARKLIPYSCLSALHYLFSKKDVSQAEEFFHKLNTGENLAKNDPVLLLRSRLIQMRHNGGIFRTREVLPYIVKAWELLRQNKEVERLVVGDDYTPTIV